MGYNTREETYNIPDKLCFASAEFVMECIKNQPYKTFKYADIGERNKKVEILEDYLKVKFDPLTAEDFNFDDFEGQEAGEKYDIITCFEILEHLQNPLFFMKNIVNRLDANGTIFLSTPSRPHMFYPSYHFHEMKPQHLINWIFSPLGLEIVKRGRLKINMRWSEHLKGIRPFLRLFINYTNIYQLKRSIE